MGFMKDHLCKCGETNPQEFHGRSKGRCKTCDKKWKRDYYASRDVSKEECKCKICGETDFSKFSANSITKCKSCITPKTCNLRLPKWICTDCKTREQSAFSESYPNRCLACIARRSRNYYYPFYEQAACAQGGEFCFICKRTPQDLNCYRLTVDHDHATGIVRGLLCSKCNRQIGDFTPEQGQRIAEYLTNPPSAALNLKYPGRAAKK